MLVFWWFNLYIFGFVKCIYFVFHCKVYSCIESLIGRYFLPTPSKFILFYFVSCHLMLRAIWFSYCCSFKDNLPYFLRITFTLSVFHLFPHFVCVFSAPVIRWALISFWRDIYLIKSSQNSFNLWSVLEVPRSLPLWILPLPILSSLLRELQL